MKGALEKTFDVRREKQARAQEIVLGRLAADPRSTIAGAMRAVGRSRETFQSWKKQSPQFKEMADGVMARRKLTVVQQGDFDKNSFVDFRKHYFRFDTFWHQQQIVDAIEKAEPGSTTLILLPPEFGKTTCLEDYICFAIAHNPNIRIAVISEGQGHARKIIGRIKNRMEDRHTFSAFHQDFGPFRSPERNSGKAWNVDYITVLGRKGDERDYTLESRGSGSKIYGSRYDLILIDDVQSIESLNTTKKLIEKYRQVWKTRVGKSGRIVFTGTRVGRGDVYEELVKLDIISKLVMIPALDAEGKSIFPPVIDVDGVRMVNDAGDPVGWSETELAQRKKDVGDEIWDRVYMQRGRSSTGQAFIEAELRGAFDRDRRPGNPPMQIPHRGYGPLAGCDPATEGHSAFVIASYDAQHLYIENFVDRENLGRNEAIFDVIEELSQRHHPTFWSIERNNMQGGLARDERLMNSSASLAAKYGFYVLEHTTGINKWDPLIGVKSMSGAFRRGEIRFPGDGGGEELFEPLIQQLLDWDPDIKTRSLRQDMVMALWFVYLRWLDIRHTMENAQSDPFMRVASPSFTGYVATNGMAR